MPDIASPPCAEGFLTNMTAIAMGQHKSGDLLAELRAWVETAMSSLVDVPQLVESQIGGFSLSEQADDRQNRCPVFKAWALACARPISGFLDRSRSNRFLRSNLGRFHGPRRKAAPYPRPGSRAASWRAAWRVDVYRIGGWRRPCLYRSTEGAGRSSRSAFPLRPSVLVADPAKVSYADLLGWRQVAPPARPRPIIRMS